MKAKDTGKAPGRSPVPSKKIVIEVGRPGAEFATAFRAARRLTAEGARVVLVPAGGEKHPRPREWDAEEVEVAA